MTWNTLSGALRQIGQTYWVRPHLDLSSFIKRDLKETRQINFLLRFGPLYFQIVFSYASNQVTYWRHFLIVFKISTSIIWFNICLKKFYTNAWKLIWYTINSNFLKHKQKLKNWEICPIKQTIDTHAIFLRHLRLPLVQ